MPVTNFPLITGVGAGGGGGSWGSITGTLADQLDLLAALNGKVGTAVNPDLYHLWSTDFMANDRAGLTIIASGTGAAVNNDTTFGMNSTERAFGVQAMTIGTSTTGRMAMCSSGTMSFGTSYMRVGTRFALSVLSDGTTTHTTYLGFCDNPGSGDATDGLYFRYTHSVNGGRWEAVRAVGGVRVAVDTGIAPVANEFQVFEVEMNQAGTEAKWYINGTLVATATTGLPGAADNCIQNFKTEKSAGTAALQMYLDWIYVVTSRSAVR